MNKEEKRTKDLKLLDEVIAHWTRMHDNPLNFDERPRSENCALCNEYNEPNEQSDDDEWCSGCPIKEYAGEPVCRNTPFGDAYRTHRNMLDLALGGIDKDLVKRAATRFSSACEDEIGFLQEIRSHLGGNEQ